MHLEVAAEAGGVMNENIPKAVPATANAGWESKTWGQNDDGVGENRDAEAAVEGCVMMGGNIHLRVCAYPSCSSQVWMKIKQLQDPSDWV